MEGFVQWWQHLPAQMDPVIFSIGSFRLQYYGLMYIVALGLTYALARYRLSREPQFEISVDQLQEFLTAAIIGALVGGRLGYVIFYNFSYYLANPLEIVLPFDFSDGIRFTGITGMSYHGGLVGCLLAALWFCRKQQLAFATMGDLLAPCFPLGYTFGRLGNFINGELYGRVTSHPIGMFFPFAPGPQRRHPSQLYEAFFEGIVLFLFLWLIKGKVRTPGAMLALYLTGYGLVRFFIEYARQPDAHLGLVFFSLSMGQVLCLTMMLAGALLLVYARKKEASEE